MFNRDALRLPPPQNHCIARESKGLYFSKKIKGFTLAEVLITLGIIGVVAALTIPTVITNYKKSQIEARLKKLYTVMNQAVLLSKAHDTWTEPSNDALNNQDAMVTWLNSALIPYLNGVEFPADFTHPNNSLNTLYKKMVLNDGTLCFLHPWRQIHVYCDINGIKGPNKTGNDIFYFFLDYDTSTSAMRGQGMANFYPAGYFRTANEDGSTTEGYVYNDRDKMIENCQSKDMNAGSSNNTCALLIMYDGWQIKDDYPVRL